jgi:ribosomal protein S6E (S10)
MAFKINISSKGRTFKLESDNEAFIKMKIGDKINGDLVSGDLDGYSLEITGTSDIAGFPGIKNQVGGQLRRMLLTKKDIGMRTTRPGGLRLKKTVRGEEISEKTVQINMKVLKEGRKKFDELCPPKEKEKKEESKEAKEEKKEEMPAA